MGERGKARLSRSEERFDVTLDVVKIDRAHGNSPLLACGRPAGKTAYTERLVVARERSRRIARIFAAGEARKAAGSFKNAYAVDLACQVETQVCDQASHETRAHHVELGRNRIFPGDRLGVAAEIALPLRLHEAEIHDLKVLAVHQNPLELGQGPAAFRSGEHDERRLRRPGWNIVIAVQPGDFFDHVLFDLEVETVRRWGYREFTARARVLQLQALEQARDLFIRELHADDLARAVRSQPHRVALRQRCSSFADRSRRAAADIEYQLRGALDRLCGGRKIHTALEAESRVAGQREASSAARDGGGIEPRSLEKYLDGRIGNRTRFPAHDPAERKRLLPVGDQQHVGA